MRSVTIHTGDRGAAGLIQRCVAVRRVFGCGALVAVNALGRFVGTTVRRAAGEVVPVAGDAGDACLGVDGPRTQSVFRNVFVTCETASVGGIEVRRPARGEENGKKQY